jgi:hypothetical protein
VNRGVHAEGIVTLTGLAGRDRYMQPISYDRHRFPPDVIRQAIWLYVRFTLSYRDVEELPGGARA